MADSNEGFTPLETEYINDVRLDASEIERLEDLKLEDPDRYIEEKANAIASVKEQRREKVKALRKQSKSKEVEKKYNSFKEKYGVDLSDPSVRGSIPSALLDGDWTPEELKSRLDKYKKALRVEEVGIDFPSIGNATGKSPETETKPKVKDANWYASQTF